MLRPEKLGLVFNTFFFILKKTSFKQPFPQNIGLCLLASEQCGSQKKATKNKKATKKHETSKTFNHGLVFFFFKLKCQTIVEIVIRDSQTMGALCPVMDVTVAIILSAETTNSMSGRA